MATPVVGCFGKLPWHGDFLRDVPAGAPIDLIDAWLAQAPIGPPGPRTAVFDAAGPAMLMVHARSMWWAMVMFPSQDAVGRRFPFCVLAGLPDAEFGGEPGLLPAVWAPFLVRCLQQGARGWPQSQSELHQVVVSCVAPIDVDHEGRRLVDALGDHRISEFWRGSLGEAAAQKRDAVWADLVGLAAESTKATGMTLKPMVHQLHLSFGLMLQHLIGDAGCAPVLIGLQPGRPGEMPGATILWGRPTAAECLAALWPTMPGAEVSRIHDPILRPGTYGEPSEAPESIGEPAVSLRDLLHQVGSATKRFTRRPRPT